MNNEPLYVERRRGWLNELRTTTIPQTTGVLHRLVQDDTHPVGMCCLGVGTVYAMEHGCPITTTDEDGIRTYDGTTNMMPEMAFKWFGFDSNDVIQRCKCS